MKREVWFGGYYATGEIQPPHLIAEVEAISFDDAVVQSHRGQEIQPIKHVDGRWTIWGVPLFDNEADAAAHFAQFG